MAITYFELKQNGYHYIMFIQKNSIGLLWPKESDYRREGKNLGCNFRKQRFFQETNENR